jgi:catechol 2,3-dioxygenase-like lactoylglutathione lyase family enzyme
MIKFAYTILYVHDVNRSVAFYEQAFGLTRKFISPENDYAEMLVGDTSLCFASVALARTNLKAGFTQSNLNQSPFGIEIGFTTPNVAETLKTAIAAGAILVEDIKTKPWGQTLAYVRDLDGFLVEICTPMG